MAVKTFVANEVLTASDTNTYLANAGLVYVTSTTVPASPAQSSVVITNCFSSTYDSYRIVYTGGTANGLGDMRLKLGSTTTGYAYNLIYTIYGNTTVQAVTSSNDASFKYIGGVATTGIVVTFDLYAPNKAERTYCAGTYIGVTTANGSGPFTGFLNDTTQYTGFTLYLDSPGTFNNGTVTVYGYRKA